MRKRSVGLRTRLSVSPLLVGLEMSGVSVE